MKSIRRVLLSLILISGPLFAQHPGYLNSNNETGIPDYGTFIHTSLDSINLQNGGVTIRLPLLTRKMRGFEHTVGIRYDSKVWVIDKVMQNNGSAGNQLWGVWRVDQESGWQSYSNLGASLDYSETEVYCPAIYADDPEQGGFHNPDDWEMAGGGQIQVAPAGWMAIRHSYVLKSGDGSKVTFPTRKIHEVSTPPNSCQDYQNSLSAINNLTGHSISGQTFLDITNDHLGTGLNYKLTFKDGSSYQVPGGILRDTNGNLAGGAGDGSGWTFDNLGRPIFKWDGWPGSSNLSYYDSNGTLQTILVQAIATSLTAPNPTFPTTTPFYQPQGPAVPSSSGYQVTLPGNLVYTFSFIDQDNPSQLNPYGEITKIILPNGGYIKYKYATIAQRDALEPDLSGMYTAQPMALDARVLVEKRISDGAGPERIWTYSYGSGTDVSFYQTTTVIDPENNVEVHTFRGDPTGRLRETAVEYRQGATTALKRVETAWAMDTGAVSAGMPVAQYGGYSNGFQMGHRNDRVVGTTTTLLDVNPAISSKTETYFTDCFQYTLPVAWVNGYTYTDCRENPTAINEYDYGIDPNNPLLKRSTLNSYLHQVDSTYDAAHIWDNVKESVVHDAAGALVGDTINSYGSSVSPTSGVPNHDAVSGPRGNLISVATWRSDNNTWLTTSNTFNDAGNVTSTTDPGGHTTYFDYTDNFTDGGNRNSQGFLTRVDLPTTNGVQHVERKQYFWNTGLTAAECGQNYPLTSGCSWSNNNPTQADHFAFSFDALNRPVTVKNGGGGWRTFQYFTDHARMEKGVAAGTYAESVYWDGLGRVTQKQINSASPYPILQDTYYDAGGKVWKQSAPYYSNDPSKGYLTRTEYDALGRVIRVTTEADGNFTTSVYSGKRTTVADQTGRTRVFENDALGNLEAVGEPHETTGVITYWTYYKYDTQGHLICVEQRGGTSASSANCGNPADGVYGGEWRVRKFKYNSLGQLLETRNPEAGINSFTYDNEGKLTSKTDARGKVATNQYDPLHRLAQTTYSDGTPTHYFGYDDGGGWLANTVGRPTYAHANGKAIEWFSYDVMGKLSHRFIAPPSLYGSGNKFDVEASYNLDGSMAWLKYPSGRKVTFGYDTAGRQTRGDFADFNGTPVNYYYFYNDAFHPDGRPSATYHPNGVVDWLELNCRLQPWRIQATKSSATLVNREYAYTPTGPGQCQAAPNNGNVLYVGDLLWNSTHDNDNARSQYFTYDQLNRILHADEGPTANVGRWGQHYTIDPWGNLSQITNTKGTSTSMSAQIDPDNNIHANTRDAAGNTIADGLHTYTWDAESRMASLDSGASTYTYDANGMRVRKQTGSNFTEYVYFGGNIIAEKAAGAPISSAALSQSGLSAFYPSQTADGDISTHGWHTDSSSAGAWLKADFGSPTVATSVRIYANSNTYVGSYSVQYSDDDVNWTAAGSIAPNNQGWNQASWSHAQPHRYWRLYLANTPGPGPWLQELELLPGGAWTDYIFAGGKRVAKAPGVASTGGTQYYHADHLGTARLMTDASGNVVAGSESTTLPYGEEYTPTPSATGNHYIFTGKERDAESGLDYFGARYYRSTSGRWLTPDWSEAPTPVPYADFSDPQSLNLYGYVGNRPITRFDIDGHCCSWGDVADFVGHAANAYMADNLGGFGRVEPKTAAGTIGAAVGDAAATVQGTLEVLGGASLEVGGTALDATGVGAVVGVPANVLGGAMIVHGSATATIGGTKLFQAATKGSPEGTIYKVPGEGTTSGNPYIGKHNKPDPAKTRRSNDGRDRKKAKVVDTYDPGKPMEGRIKEQQHIDKHGLENLDNKRNEIRKDKKKDAKK